MHQVGSGGLRGATGRWRHARLARERAVWQIQRRHAMLGRRHRSGGHHARSTTVEAVAGATVGAAALGLPVGVHVQV